MQLAYMLGGGSAVIKRYKMNSAVAVGAVVIRGTEDGATTGLSTSTTVSMADAAVGVRHGSLFDPPDIGGQAHEPCAGAFASGRG